MLKQRYLKLSHPELLSSFVQLTIQLDIMYQGYRVTYGSPPPYLFLREVYKMGKVEMEDEFLEAELIEIVREAYVLARPRSAPVLSVVAAVLEHVMETKPKGELVGDEQVLMLHNLFVKFCRRIFYLQNSPHTKAWCDNI